jgi:predicted amidohydrolase YtcJ
MALLAPHRAGAQPQPVDLVIKGGKVLTIDRAFSIKSAIAIKDGKIVAVGGDEIARDYKAAKTIDLNGRVLMPGFMDTHLHVHPEGRRDVELTNARSIADLQQQVRAKAQELGPGKWVTGMEWDEARFTEKRNPTRQDLDAAAPNNPVILVRAGRHSTVGNSAALKLAGITRDTPQPDRGVIEHGSDGEPNGMIRERADLYRAVVPPLTWEEVRESYIRKLKVVLEQGITSIIEASGSIDDEPVGFGGVAHSTTLGTFHQLQGIFAEYGANLPRVAMYISYPGTERLNAFPHHTGYGDDRLRIGPIGESAVDGGFTGPTAWTLVDYKGLPGFHGKGRYTDAELQELVDTSARLGWQVGLHAIGDAAIVQTVGAYSKALRGIVGADKDHRWFLDHFTIMPPESTMNIMSHDHIRIAQQPNFTYTLEDRYVATLDDWRLQHTNSVVTPWRKHGLFIAFGSDDLPIGPMVGLYTAVTRKGMSGKTYGAEEAITIRDALRMYTANGPYLTWEEKVKGTLEPGKLADMIVLDTDPLTNPPQALLTTKVDLTIVGGKVVYDRSHVGGT